MPDIQANFQVLLLITDIQSYVRENKTHMSITDFSIPRRHAHAFILFLNMQKKKTSTRYMAEVLQRHLFKYILIYIHF